MITKERRAAFRFFCEQAGYATPPGRAACALELARAEELLEQAVDLGIASVEWVDDETPWDEGTEISAEDAARRFESGEWTGPYGCIVRVFAEGSEHADTLSYLDRVADADASLWGIVVGSRGTDDPYCRVVAAELADELVDELRQAIGDARDAQEEI